MPIKPITPLEATGKKCASIPDFVIDAFNELIVEELDSSGRACFQQDVVIQRVIDIAHSQGFEVTRHQIFDKRWLDVEDLYRAQGWKVVYEKPAYCESFPATFTFKT